MSNAKIKKRPGNVKSVFIDIGLGILFSLLALLVQGASSVVASRVVNFLSPSARALLQHVGDTYVNTGITDHASFNAYYGTIMPAATFLELLLFMLIAMKSAQRQKTSLCKPMGPYTGLIIIGCSVVINYLVSVPMEMIPSIKALSDSVTPYVDILPVPVLLIFVGLLAPLAEELIFRKLMFGTMLKYGVIKAIIISGLFFGLMHGNWVQFLYAFPLGMFLSWLYWKSGENLTASFLCHAAINTSSVVLERAGLPWMNLVLITTMIFAFYSYVQINENRGKLYRYSPDKV